MRGGLGRQGLGLECLVFAPKDCFFKGHKFENRLYRNRPIQNKQPAPSPGKLPLSRLVENTAHRSLWGVESNRPEWWCWQAPPSTGTSGHCPQASPYSAVWPVEGAFQNWCPGSGLVRRWHLSMVFPD